MALQQSLSKPQSPYLSQAVVKGTEGGLISWHAHMEPLMQAFAADNRGFSFSDPAQLLHFLQWVVGYVDNNSLILSFRDGQPIAEVLKEAQKALSSWQKLLQLTGGDLALEKCVYSVMGWQHKKGKEVLSSIQGLPGNITIDSKLQDPVQIKRIEPWEAERILGVRCALDGSDATEFEYRLAESHTLAGRITQAPLDRFDAEVVCRERWMASIK